MTGTDRIAKGLYWDRAWSLVEGCTPVSEGCRHCWSAAATHMRAAQTSPAIRARYGGLALKQPGHQPFFCGRVRTMDADLAKPFAVRRPTTWCVWNDLFHPDVPDGFILHAVQVMADCPEHTFLVLTKRPNRMRDWFATHWDPSRQVEQPRVENRTCASLYLRQPCCTECGKFFMGCLNGRKKWKDDAITPNMRDSGQMDWWGRPSGLCDAFVWSRCGNQHSVAVEMGSNHLAVREDAICGPFPAPLKNLWLGVTAENQETADERIPLLLQTPAAVRFVSLEPLLGAVDLDGYLEPECCTVGDPEGEPYLDWTICGGETGPGARPMHPDWVRSVRDQCEASGVPFFLKSWGEWKPGRSDWSPDKPLQAARWIENDDTLTEWGRPQTQAPRRIHRDGKVGPLGMSAPDDAVFMTHVGRKAAGRLLGGRTHDEMPWALAKEKP